MSDDRTLLERQMQRVELRPFTLDGFHRQRSRRQRNRRIGSAVVAMAVAVVAIGGLLRALSTERVPADELPPTFVGAWVATDLHDEGSLMMTIGAAEDGTLDIALRDDASGMCSDAPAELTGAGRLVDATTLVVSSPDLACGDSRQPKEGLEDYTLVIDPATDRLFDSLEVVWHRGARPERSSDTPTGSGEAGTGTGPRAFLGGEVTLHVAEPWTVHLEAYIDPRLFFLTGRGDAWIEILANPVLPGAKPCTVRAGVPASAEELVQAILSDPDLQATEPVSARVGGVDALRLDVDANAGATICPDGRAPVVSVSERSGWGGVEPSGRGRLYVLDMPGGSARALAIWITAPEAEFERAVEEASTVVESVRFQTG